MIKEEIQNFLGFEIHNGAVDYQILSSEEESSFTKNLISYLGSENDEINAFLFIPRNRPVIGSVLVHHQHNGERHLGKSEVAGIAGDPYQAFCPELAKRGIVSLAPDSISFEDRRTNKKGIEPDTDPDNDWLQHYNEMAYRLLDGKTLMKKVIDDSAIATSLLTQLEITNPEKVGILGHSYGGNTVIFHSPFDDRIKYSCSSGAVCTYRTKFAHATGIELAEVIPGFTSKYDIEDLLKLVCPRDLLIMTASKDIYARDAEDVYHKLKPIYEKMGRGNSLNLGNFQGGHALNQERFEFILDWFVGRFTRG